MVIGTSLAQEADALTIHGEPTFRVPDHNPVCGSGGGSAQYVIEWLRSLSTLRNAKYKLARKIYLRPEQNQKGSEPRYGINVAR